LQEVSCRGEKIIERRMLMELFMRKPDITLFSGIKVTKDTKLEFKSENAEQTIENLVLKSVTKVKGANYESEYHTTVQLEEGDVLIFEQEGRGYIKPVDAFCTVTEAIDDLSNIKGIGESDV
jgi:hypothetical protein